jgi:hypothetical protein
MSQQPSSTLATRALPSLNQFPHQFPCFFPQQIHHLTSPSSASTSFTRRSSVVLKQRDTQKPSWKEHKVEWGCDPLNLLRSDQNQAASGSLSGGGGQSAPLGLAARKSCRPVDLEISRSQQIPIEPFNLMQPLAVAPSSQVPPALGPSASLPRFSRSFVEVVRSSAPPPAQPQGRKVCFNLRPSVITSRSSDNPAYFVPAHTAT